MLHFVTGYFRQHIHPPLKHRSPTGQLSSDEMEVIYALFEVLADDSTFPREAIKTHVDYLTQKVPGYYHEFHSGLKLIRRKSIYGAFQDLPIEERNKVLHSLLRPYPHVENIPLWRQLLKLTGENLNALAAPTVAIRFRQYVVRPLLGLYYRGAAGWNVVGYEKYPGRVISDLEPGTVIDVIEDAGRLLIVLADDTIETLHSKNLVSRHGTISEIRIKGGKQIAKLDAALPLSVIEKMRGLQATAVPTPEPEVTT